MLKRDEIEQPTSCINKAASDEPVFVLRAKDLCSADTVMFWAQLAENLGAHDPAKIAEARALADQMREWRTDHMMSRRTEAAAKAANKFEGVSERPPANYGVPGLHEQAIEALRKREERRGYQMTVAMTAGASLLAATARDADEPLTDTQLRKVARQAFVFAQALADEVHNAEA